MKLNCGRLSHGTIMAAFLLTLGRGAAPQAGSAVGNGGPEFLQASADLSADQAVYHIEVSMLESCINFGCEHPLTEKNIVLSENGRALGVHVERAGTKERGSAAPVPVHVLIVFAPGSRRPADTELEKSLKPLFSAGWLISVQRTDGAFTPYSGGSEPARVLERPSLAATGAGGESATEKAIEDLSSRVGLRFLLVETSGHSFSSDPAWMSRAAGELDLVYAVDGGNKRTYPDCVQTPTGHGFPAGGGLLCMGRASKRVRAYKDRMVHELTWRKAIKHLVSDRKYDYDVEFRLADSRAKTGRSLTITLDDPYSYGPNRVSLDSYASAAESSADTAEGRRRSSGLRLQLIKKRFDGTGPDKPDTWPDVIGWMNANGWAGVLKAGG